MKKFVVLLILLVAVSSLQAKVTRSSRALLEIGPKGTLYLAEGPDNDVRFGIGAEIVINPVRNIGIRLDITELSFGEYTLFYINQGMSLDALIYFPMKGMQPYFHTGFGFSTISNGGSVTYYSIRAGLGFNFSMKGGTDLFLEPGINITGNGETDLVFRTSFGARFGMF
ncbi:MAG: hypothetical protein JSW02_05490 [candidate division WOR-3 bacterium]|nr:MAG: hypothetical protein JSW02_05490 [candidate division WOR-3 bacterium]